jgi:endoglucanase
VRLPLNEACWLDLKSQLSPYNPAYTGLNYRRAIIRYVRLLHAHGLYVILELHWNGTAKTFANWSHPMPDAQYAPTFWTSVARTFQKDRAVVYDLFNEPNWNDWPCWQHGCTVWPGTDGAYEAAGMQQLVDAVRSTGSVQPILLEGNHYSADVGGWLDNEPTDPAKALVVSPHLYDYSCKTIDCVRKGAGYDILVKIAKKVPVVFGELGEKDCSSAFVEPVMQWADEHGFSYLAWAWNASSCSGFPSLVSNYDGTPTAFGRGFREHFVRVNP